ncbi:MAG: hypothetical protein JXA30_22160 [Deltaproteobacteria bacterium]|nr:hypothetical protein [Deltaproteobacteria bacterium]
MVSFQNGREKFYVIDVRKVSSAGSMNTAIKEFIETTFHVPPIEGEDKRCSIKEAIQQHVKERMAISLSNAASALVSQLVREFQGRKPDFTLITSGLTLQMLALVQQKLVRKAVASFAGISYPSPRPCPIIQNRYGSRDLEIENWTMLTITERLLAGAMGWEVIPTRSLIGSSMEIDNADFFKVIDNPFDSQAKIGLLSALRPDITLIHGAVADRSGNTVLTYPLVGDAFGAWAAKKGVIVSVDKIVSTETIRRYSHLVRIPSYMVLAVCEAPFGIHPGGVTPHGMPGFEAYYPDYDFITKLNDAAMDEKAFDRWVHEWILDCPDHDAYLAKLGYERLFALQGQSHPNAWEAEASAEASKVDFEKAANALERLVIAGSKIIADRCISKGYRTILGGIGLPNLAAWLAAYRLGKGDHSVDLVAEIGMLGHLPKPSDPTAFGFHHMHSSKLLANLDALLGVIVTGSGSRCLGVLGAGQIDRFGNANSTKISNEIFLVGSGGANDVATSAQETIVVMSATKDRLVEKVPYVTYPGARIKTLVTEYGIFEKQPGRDAFALTAYIPSQPSETEAQSLAKLKDHVGWSLEIAPALDRVAPPDQDTLTLLRLFDPRGYFVGE